LFVTKRVSERGHTSWWFGRTNDGRDVRFGFEQGGFLPQDQVAHLPCTQHVLEHFNQVLDVFVWSSVE
jgi:hypothetical protein